MVWQVSDVAVANGPGHAFFDYGVLLIGPGDPGPWIPGRPDGDFDGAYVRWLAHDIQHGDTVVMRRGASQVIGVGIIDGDYQYLDQFDDVTGWDLQHARRVRWYQLPFPHVFGNPAFGANPRRLSCVWNPAVLNFAAQILANAPAGWNAAPLPQLPRVQLPLAAAPPDVVGLVAQIQQLAPGYWNNGHFGEHPCEDEFLAHYVVPMFRFLRWPPELIAVKWRNVDVTLFRQLPRVPENVAIAVEVKRLGGRVEDALQQLITYSQNLNIRVPALVTDGFRYRLYYPSPWGTYTPVAYANLTNLKIGALQLFNALRRP